MNMTQSESTMSKKHHSVYYHRAQAGVEAVIFRVSKENSLTSLADLFTKKMLAPKR